MTSTNGLSTAIHTQFTDVEGERNGLMTYDRQMLKMDVERIRAAHRQLYAEAGHAELAAAGSADPTRTTRTTRPVSA